MSYILVIWVKYMFLCRCFAAWLCLGWSDGTHAGSEPWKAGDGACATWVRCQREHPGWWRLHSSHVCQRARACRDRLSAAWAAWLWHCHCRQRKQTICPLAVQDTTTVLLICLLKSGLHEFDWIKNFFLFILGRQQCPVYCPGGVPQWHCSAIICSHELL